jgi:hypothetical protein
MDGGNVMKIDGMGVVVIVAHLIITITVIGSLSYHIVFR